MNLAANGDAGDGAFDRAATPDLDNMVTMRIGQPQNLLLPFRECPVINRVGRTESTGHLELVIAGRGRDDPRAGCAR